MKNIKTKFFIIILVSSFFVTAQTDLQNKYNLMPWPQEIKETSGKFIINENFSISIVENSEKVNLAATKFLRKLADKTGVFIDEGFPNTTKNGSLQITFEKEVEVVLGIDESYSLEIKDHQIKIQSKTNIGAIRALETLLQLVSNDGFQYYFPNVSIEDTPRFLWRGLMIDVARHFEPIDVIKRNLDAMASVKMNVFHWHLSDDQGFRVQVNSRPKLHELASDGEYYTQNQIKEIVAYATNLGIRVVPEFDIPGHATSWLLAYPEMGSKNMEYKPQRFAGIFDPTLDPTKEITYQILDDVFSELAPLFPDAYFHIGGDENEGKHWDENAHIQKFKKEKNLKNNHELQTYFNIRVQKILEKNNKIMMGWDEIFQPSLPKNVVIHSWRGKKAMINAAKQGYKTVLSKGYYIDLLLSVNKHYTNDPLDDNHGLTKEQEKNILGGEATMWGELVTPLTIDSRIWPRTAAIAERFWSSKEVNDVENMRKRLEVISFNLEQLGITHIRNRDVILRNITDNQDITALQNLVKICEPLKIYTRNKGGTEYKSFSPFTLFADACTADAYDAYVFNNEVLEFTKNPTAKNKQKLLEFLNKWIKNDDLFNTLQMNSKLKPLVNLSSNLKGLSLILKKGLQKNKLKKSHKKIAYKTLNKLKKPVADTDLMLIDSFEVLLKYLAW